MLYILHKYMYILIKIKSIVVVVVDAIRMFDNKWEMYEETRQVEYVPSVAGTIACNEITRSYYIICSRSVRLFPIPSAAHVICQSVK